MLNLSSAFLMIALSNEDESGQSRFWPDGSERFADTESVTDKDLDNLLSSLGIAVNMRLNHLSRADVFPVLQACVDSNSDLHVTSEFDNILVSGPLSALGSSILGTLEWITSVWIMDVDPEEGMQWRNRGIMRVLEAADKQSVAVKIAKEGPTQPMDHDVDHVNIGGDGGVFTIAAGLHLLQAALSPLSFNSTENEVGLIDATLGDGVNFLVWSWAINNSRLQVCASCAPTALNVSMQGHGAVTTTAAASGESSNSNAGGSTVEPFPCMHLKSSQEKPIALSPEIRASLIPGGRLALKKDVVAMAAGDVLGAMVRRATKGRSKDLEKVSSWVSEKDEKGRLKYSKGKRDSSVIFKEPLAWRQEAKTGFSGGSGAEGGGASSGAGEKDLVNLLKKLALHSMENDKGKVSESDLERDLAEMVAQKAKQFNQLEKTQSEWINLFYRDAAASVKRSKHSTPQDGELPEYSVVET
jgi:hypothetical protein